LVDIDEKLPLCVNGAGHAAGDDGAEFGMAEESGIATPSTGDPVRPGRAREGKKLLRDSSAVD